VGSSPDALGTRPAAPDRPSFDHPWQRRAFGMAVTLSEFGYYDWPAFQQQLIDAIGRWEQGSDQTSWEYYEHWLAALEAIMVRQGLVTSAELAALELEPPTSTA
jgi:nitrile hydratase accessory protein